MLILGQNPNPMRRSIVATVLTLLSSIAFGQTPISNVVSNYQPVNSGLSYLQNAAQYNYGNLSGVTNNNQTIDGVVLSNGSYLYSTFIDGVIKLRRVNNATCTGRKSLLWMESQESSGAYNLFPAYTDSMEVFFNGRTINKGTDNLFGNQGDDLGNNNNIERVDWIFSSGVVTNKPADSGFPVFERGADDMHDPFCIAAVIALDNNGDPAQYGRILRVASSHYGNLPNSSLNYSILRKEEAETRLYRTGAGNQNRGGVFVSFQDLGIDSGQAIYGYSLFPHDLPSSATPSNLIDYTNTTYFPTNTSSNTSEGGIDLIAYAGLIRTTSTDVVLPIRYTNWKVNAVGNKAILDWQLENANTCKKIEVQKSYNGSHWQTIAVLSPSEVNYTDETVRSGANYYRLKLHDVKVFTYTTTKKINYKASNITDFKIKKGSKIEVEYTVSNAGKVNIQLVDQAGKLVADKTQQCLPGVNKIYFDLPLNKGIFLIRLFTNNTSISKKVLL